MKKNDCWKKSIWFVFGMFSLMVMVAKAEILFTENWDSNTIDANVWSVTGDDIVLKNLGDGDYALAMIGDNEGGSPSWSDYIYSVASYNCRSLAKGKDLRITYKVWYKQNVKCGIHGGFHNSDGNSIYVNPEATIGYICSDYRANESGDATHGPTGTMDDFTDDWPEATTKLSALKVKITLDKDKGAKWEYSNNGGLTWIVERDTMGDGNSVSTTNYIGFGTFNNQDGTTYIDDIEVSTVFTEDWDANSISPTYWNNTDSNDIVLVNLGGGDYALALKGTSESAAPAWGDHIYSNITFKRSDKLAITYKAWWKSGTSKQCGIHGGFHTNNTSNVYANMEAAIGYLWQDYRAAEYGDGNHGLSGTMPNFTDDWVYATSKANSILVRIILDPNNGAKWQYSNNGGVTWIVERDTMGDGNSVGETNYIGFGPFNNQSGTTMIDDITVETITGNDELAYDIRDLSEHFQPEDDFEASRWIFVPEANVAKIKTSSHPDQLMIQATGGQDIKGILRNAITIDEYSLPWEFKLGITQDHTLLAAAYDTSGQRNVAIGLNIAVTFSDPNTWPSDRTQEPNDTHSFQLFNVHIGGRGTGLPQLVDYNGIYRTTAKDTFGEAYLVYGRGDLGANQPNPIHLGHWEVPYVWCNSLTSGPASSEIFFNCVVQDQRYLKVGMKFESYSGGYHMRVIDCHEFGDITGIWEIGPIISGDDWIADTMCPDMNIPDTPVSVASPDANAPYFIDFCTFQSSSKSNTPVPFEELSDDFDIIGYTGQWRAQQEDVIVETHSNPGYMTWTLLGGDTGTGIAPIQGDVFDLDSYPPPWEMEVCFMPSEDKIPWNFYMNFSMRTNEDTPFTWHPGVRYDMVTEKHVQKSDTFNVTWADSNEPNETLMSSRPLYMLVQWIDVNNVRYGFRADPNDDWNLSNTYNYASDSNVIPPGEYLADFKQADWSTEARSYDKLPKYTKILIDYVHYRYGLSTE